VSTFALDSSAVVAWVLQEAPRWRAIDAILSSPDADPILPGPALSEVITVARKRGNASSVQLLATALLARMRVEHCTTEDLIRAAELYEASERNPGPPHPRTGVPPTLSRADSLILAVAERLRVQIVTRDRYWLDFVAAGHASARILEI
jgi:predicted nucleic acid-binding protein